VGSKYKTISKESSNTSSQLLRLPEVRNLFLVLGYQEVIFKKEKCFNNSFIGS